MQAIESDQRQDLRNTLTDAVRQQPEHVAEAVRLAKRYPAPIDALASNLQDVKLQEAVDKYDETLKTSPKLQQYILDKPWETARLHKDIPQLSLLEQTFNVARSVPAGAVRGLGSVASGAGTLYDIAARQLAKPIIAIGGDAARDFLNTPIPQLLDPSATLLKRPGQSLKTIADVIGVDPANRNFATDVGEGIGQLIQQIGVQIATGGTASLATLFSQGADVMATKTAKDAASQDAKDAAVLTGASITALTEKYGVDKLLNRVPPKIKNDALRWVADKLAAGGIEATQEIVEGVLQDVVRVALTNADAEIGDGALYEGGVAATSAAIVRAALGVRVRSNEQIERYDRAVEASNNLRQQLRAVQDIQARAHSPEVFREVVQGMADQTEGAPKSLWVDGEVLAQLPAEELATLPAEVQEQIADAAASSGFVEIPIGDIMLAEQGSVLEQTYVEYARETPDSPTLTEAQEAKALMESTLMQDAEGAIAQAQEQDTIRASSEVVRKAVLEQLNTAGAVARRYRPSVNDALARVTAALFTTQAQRMNMTPEQLFVDSGFAVRGRGQGPTTGGRVLNAGGKTTIYHGTTPEAAAAIERDGFDVSRSADGTIWFTSNQDIGEVAATGSGAVVARAFDEANLKLGGWEESDKFSTDELIAQGYDGLKLEDDGETTYQIFNPEKLDKVNADTEQNYAVAKTQDVDPNTLVFREEDQNRTENVKADWPDGGYPAIVVILEPNGDKLILDGHNRAAVAKEKKHTVDVVTLRRAEYDALSEKFDDMEITYAALMEAEEYDAASNVNNQFPGAGVADQGDKALSLLNNGQFSQSVTTNGTTPYAQDTITIDGKERPALNSNGQRIASTEEGLRNFWAWFGGSKVVDADGKPLVVYHGTNANAYSEEDFNTFNTRPASGRGGAFFTDNETLAGQYGEQTYSVYLKAENPLEVQADGAGWTALGAGTKVKGGVTDTLRGESARQAKSLTDVFADLEELFGETGGPVTAVPKIGNEDSSLDGKTLGDLPGLDGEQMETDKVVKAARRLGYDSVIFRQVQDSPTADAGYARVLADVQVVFDPTQVKSATGNNGQFNPQDANILRQGPRGTYSPRNFEIVLNENANLSTYFHELSHFYLDFLGRMAEMPGASPEVVEDFNTFLQWAKVTPEQWREWRDFVVANPNKPLPKGMVKVHESLASAGEQYFLEGKAPSLELQPFMRRFARWMESVYRSLRQFIAGNPNKELQLNADIRRFFDRALATDEEIAQAEQAAGMLPDDDATAEAKERLNKRSMGDLKWSVRMRDGFIADLRKQAKEIRDSIRQTVTEEVDAMPAMQAKDALDRLMAASPEYKADLKAWKDAREAELARATEAVKAQLVAAEEAKTNAPLEGLAKGRFLSKNRAEVENKAEAAALKWEKQNPKPRRITPDMTPQMESIADKYGYTSVDQMLADIDVTGSRRELIDGMTEQRMLEDHGDLIDERAIQQAANEAVHNDARARSLATELRTQQEMLGERADTGRTARNGRKITTNILLAAARNFAANVVGRAKILDLGNLAWKHNSAEARAGKRWQQLTSQGKTVEAVKAKQDQVLNNAAAKAAQEAQAEMRKLLDYVNKFDKESVRAKLPASYLDQIDKLRERVDLRVSTTRRDIDKRAALSKWIESQHALGLDPIVPDYLLDDAQLTSYKEMTVDQFREFADTIKNIEHLGRLKSKLLAAKDKREFDIIVAEIVQEIVANKGTPLPVQLEPDGRIKKFFKGAWADHRKLNSLVRQMDGGKDNGPLYRALVRSMNEAGTKENVMLEQATEAMAKIYAPIEKLPGGFSGASVYIPEINASLSRAGRLAIALNWGNSTNRQRVMGGDNWTEAQVEAILATLSTTELEFVNNVWAQLDSYWPEMKAKQERVSGVVEDKVEAEPFELTAADGIIVQMRGGYYPIKYDSDRSLKSQKNEAQEVAADMLRGAILRPSTRRGHLKARVDEVNRPVRKDLSVITQHVNQVVHDLAWHEWLIDATRLLNDPRIAGSIRDYYGAETHRAMTDSMRAIAEGDIAHQTEIDKLLLLMRSNVTRSIMGASLTTALLQPFGLTQSMARIGVVPVLKGAWRWAGEGAQMQNSMKWIGEKSDFMRLRSKTFNRELREISQRVQGKSKFMQVADASLFFLMQKLQMVADVPTWIGAYEKALAGGVDDATAVQLADEAVLGSQGGGNTKDLAGVQRNLPFLTQFYSYFSTTLQLVAEKTALTDFKNPRAVAGWLGDMALLAVIPAILPALITYLLKGGGEDDEPEDWAKRLAEWQASYVLGMFVGLRELPAVWSPFDYQGPPAGKLINDGKRLVQQAGQGEIDDQAVLATIGFLGTALGIPTTQLVRSYKGWLAWDEGDAPPSSILFGPPPKD